jgi:hypothetical protein
MKYPLASEVPYLPLLVHVVELGLPTLWDELDLGGHLLKSEDVTVVLYRYLLESPADDGLAYELVPLGTTVPRELATRLKQHERFKLGKLDSRKCLLLLVKPYPSHVRPLSRLSYRA